MFDVPDSFHWRVLTGLIAVVVHSNDAPSDEDWDTCHQDIAKQLGNLRGMLVYANETGPSASQRARSTEVLKGARSDFQTVIMTRSRMVRGMVTAFSWTLTGNVKAFSTQDLTGALGCFNLTDEERLTVRVTLKHIARLSGTSIDAFADESGQFQKKYK